MRYITYSTVDRPIASIFNLDGIFTLVLCASVNMVPQSGILAIDLPTVLYVYRSVTFFTILYLNYFIYFILI